MIPSLAEGNESSFSIPVFKKEVPVTGPSGRYRVLIHFEKGNPDYKGSYQAINQMFLDEVKDQFEYVNREQDLGDEGLRKAKMSYHPIAFVKKFCVSA